MKFHAFISYRRKNGFEMAQLIRDRLKERGIECYLDLEEVKAGKFNEQLLNTIRDTPNFILVLPKGALDRCVHEKDWVRREILEAMKNPEKTVIPVIYPNFEWPRKLYDKLPAEIVGLENAQGVVASYDYFSAMIEKIVGYMTNVTVCDPLAPKVTLYRESSLFFTDKTESVGTPVSLDMAFHAGSEWRRNTDMVDCLTRMLEAGYPIRVIINSPASVQQVCAHMRQPRKHYVKIEDNLLEWKELAEECGGNMEVRVLDVPLLHRLYVVRGENGGSVNVKYYSYGNYVPEKDFRLTFDSPDPSYKLYAEEFEYLWSIARPLSEA